MAALEVWDDSPVPWWSQLRRRLRDDPGVWSLLERALGEHPATSGHLTGLRPLRPPRPSFSAWLTGTWHPDGTQVLVKVNATRRERFWMSAASQGAPGSVPHVFASDDALGPVDASWLVLERLPYTHDPGWGAAAFSSLLAAAARFQIFAAAVDTDLVVNEDIETIRRFALRGQDLCPEAATVVSHLDRDWGWAEAVAPCEVLFGDLHFGNAAFRSPPPDLAALLYDPIPRRQPWPFEPAYLEVLCNGSGLVREMAAIRRGQGRAVCEPDEVDQLSALFCGWLALAFWSMLLDWHADPAQRARLARYVSAAAHLDRLRHDAAPQPAARGLALPRAFRAPRHRNWPVESAGCPFQLTATISCGSIMIHPFSRSRRTMPSGLSSTPVSLSLSVAANPIGPILLMTMCTDPALPMRGLSRSLSVSPVTNHHLRMPSYDEDARGRARESASVRAGVGQCRT